MRHRRSLFATAAVIQLLITATAIPAQAAVTTAATAGPAAGQYQPPVTTRIATGTVAAGADNALAETKMRS